MDKQIENGVDSSIDTNDVEAEGEEANEADDVNVLKEKLQKVNEANKQLFMRAKKAEGFELKEGKWVKPKAEPKVDKEPFKESQQPKERTGVDLDYGQLALLRTEGIKGPGEVALFKEIMSETGKGVLDVIDSNYFKSRLTDFREAQAHAQAIPRGKRQSQGTVSDIDIALAKFHESGKLPEDFKARSEVVKKLVEQKKSENMFTGPSVIGPQEQIY